MKHIHLENQPEAVRQFLLNLSVPDDGAVLDYSGQAVMCVVPPPKAGNGAPANEEEWTDAKNERRCGLIDRKYAGTITPQEVVELAVLQEEMIRYRERVAPLPLEDVRHLHQELLMKAKKQARKNG